MRGWQWNVFDCIVVLLQLIEEVVTIAVYGYESADASTVNFSAIRILRLFRFVRIVRLVKMLHTENICESLELLGTFFLLHFELFFIDRIVAQDLSIKFDPRVVLRRAKLRNSKSANTCFVGPYNF